MSGENRPLIVPEFINPDSGTPSYLPDDFHYEPSPHRPPKTQKRSKRKIILSIIKWITTVALAALVLTFVIWGQNFGNQTPIPTATARTTAVTSPSPKSLPGLILQSTLTPRPTATPTASPTPTFTPTASPKPSPSPTPTATPTLRPTSTPKSTVTPKPTPSSRPRTKQYTGVGKSLLFKSGDTVIGWAIEINGVKIEGRVILYNSPVEGILIDGVINPDLWDVHNEKVVTIDDFN